MIPNAELFKTIGMIPNAELFELKITKKICKKLSELGVYHEWVYNTQMEFDRLKLSGLIVECEYLLSDIQESINNNDVKDLVSCSFDWDKTKEGIDYWNGLYEKL